MISDITGIDYNLLKDNIILETNELPIHKRNEKFKRCDFIVKVDHSNMILNLELNRQSYTGLVVKNLSYVFQLFSSSFKKGERYDDNFVVMQINLNCFKDLNQKAEKALSKYFLKEETDEHIYTRNLIIYTLNIVKCHELYYNYDSLEIPNYVRWGALLYCKDLSKVKEITKGIMTYEERNVIMGILDKLTKEDLFMSEEDAIAWDNWEKNTIYHDGIKEGIEQGIEQGLEQGIEQEKINTIKEMLKKSISLTDISDITGKSIVEIKEIEKNIN